jgi:hypothetical protein
LKSTDKDFDFEFLTSPEQGTQFMMEHMRGVPMHLVRRDLETIVDLVATTCHTVKNTRQQRVMVMYNVTNARGMYRDVFNHIVDGTYREHQDCRSMGEEENDAAIPSIMRDISPLLNGIAHDFQDDECAVSNAIEYARLTCGVSRHVLHCLARCVVMYTNEAFEELVKTIHRRPMDTLDMLTLGLFLDLPRLFLDFLADESARCFDGMYFEMAVRVAQQRKRKRDDEGNGDDVDFERPFAWFLKQKLFRPVQESWKESVVGREFTNRVFTRITI